MWIRRYLETKECAHCGSTGILHRANVSGKYLRDISDWKVLCPACHSEFDGHSKIPRAEESKIIKLRNSGMTFVEIAKRYGVTRKAIEKKYYRLTK